MGHHKFLMPFHNKYIMLYYIKSIMTYDSKFLMLYDDKSERRYTTKCARDRYPHGPKPAYAEGQGGGSVELGGFITRLYPNSHARHHPTP